MECHFSARRAVGRIDHLVVAERQCQQLSAVDGVLDGQLRSWRLVEVVNLEPFSLDVGLSHIWHDKLTEVLILHVRRNRDGGLCREGQQQLGAEARAEGNDVAVGNEESRLVGKHRYVVLRQRHHLLFAYAQLQAVADAAVVPPEVHDRCCLCAHEQPQPLVNVERGGVLGGIECRYVQLVGQLDGLRQPPVGHPLHMASDGGVLAGPEVFFLAEHLAVGMAHVEALRLRLLAGSGQLTQTLIDVAHPTAHETPQSREGATRGVRLFQFGLHDAP